MNRAPELEVLEGRSDLAVLWDIRVAPEVRRQGVGSSLFGAAEGWARARGCLELKVETQTINVPACHFYPRHGCVLKAVRPDAYPTLPHEVQLLAQGLRPSDRQIQPEANADDEQFFAEEQARREAAFQVPTLVSNPALKGRDWKRCRCSGTVERRVILDIGSANGALWKGRRMGARDGTLSPYGIEISKLAAWHENASRTGAADLCW